MGKSCWDFLWALNTREGKGCRLLAHVCLSEEEQKQKAVGKLERLIRHFGGLSLRETVVMALLASENLEKQSKVLLLFDY